MTGLLNKLPAYGLSTKLQKAISILMWTASHPTHILTMPVYLRYLILSPTIFLFHIYDLLTSQPKFQFCRWWYDNIIICFSPSVHIQDSSRRISSLIHSINNFILKELQSVTSGIAHIKSRAIDVGQILSANNLLLVDSHKQFFLK